MPELPAVLTAAGIGYVRTVIAECAASGVPVEHACVLLIKETSGGQNIWGHDRTPVPDSALPYTKGGPVTPQNVAAYLAQVAEIGRQGCGPLQLTHWTLQDQAVAEGGLHDPAVTIRVGLRHFGRLLRAHGAVGAFERYRGIGPGAAYAAHAMTLLPRWAAIVASATPTPAPPPQEVPVPVSQNGYPANDRSLVARQTVPGTGVAVTVRKDAPGWLLLYVLEQFDRRVEDLDMDSTRGEDDDWGYAERPVRGTTDVLSNHSSGTAVDANATRHVLGAANTFTSAQKAAIRQILAECEGCVRWGGDYTARKDEMHFEIVKPLADCERTQQRLQARGGTPAAPTPEEDDMAGEGPNILGFIATGGPSTRVTTKEQLASQQVDPTSLFGRVFDMQMALTAALPVLLTAAQTGGADVDAVRAIIGQAVRESVAAALADVQVDADLGDDDRNAIATAVQERLGAALVATTT